MIAGIETAQDQANSTVPTVARTEPRYFHRIREVREQQGISIRTAARRLDLSVSEAEAQEDGSTDLPLSYLHRWQQALDVPITELIQDAQLDLSPAVHNRARMVKVMKTVATIRELSTEASTHRMINMLVSQLTEIMPELADIGPWQASGSQRGLDDLGSVVERRVSSDLLSV